MRDIVVRRKTATDDVIYFDSTFQMPQEQITKQPFRIAYYYLALSFCSGHNKFTLTHQGAEFTVTGAKIEPFSGNT